MKPQLSQPLPVEELPAYINDDTFWWSQKVDGHRKLVQFTDRIRVYGKEGQTTDLPAEVKQTLAPLATSGVALDGELIGKHFWLFDMPEAAGRFTTATSFEERRTHLEALFSAWQPTGHVHLVPIARTPVEKQKLATAVITSRGEGVILNRIGSLYVPGHRIPGVLKAKLVKELDVVVIELGRKGKASLGVGLYRDGELVEVGAVTVNNTDLRRAKIGDVLTIRYQHAGANGRLVNPAGGKLRTDKAAESCDYTQLSFINKEVLKELP